MGQQPSPATRQGPAEPVVSVVVPVHDAMPYLRTLLESLLAQDLADYEVVAVDDGSTDGGGELLEEYAAAHPRLRVVHQENSGWPGAPRNRGLDLARGRYVFFADADDEVAPQTLRRLSEFADRHGSDVVLPRVLGHGGRPLSRRLYLRNRVDADLEQVFTVLGPHKLFRRSFLLEQGIRFPEGRVRLEDAMMLARAYLTARRVSLVADPACSYRLVRRDDGRNISSQPFDPVGYTASVAEVSRIIRELDPDPARADRIVLDLYRRKCLKFYQPERWWRMPPERREAFLAEHRRYVRSWITPAMEAGLPREDRRRSALVRAGDGGGLLELAARGVDDRPWSAEMVAGRWDPAGLQLDLRCGGGPPTLLRRVELHLQDRGSSRGVELRLRATDFGTRAPGTLTPWSTSVTVPWALLERSAPVVLDVSVQVRGAPAQDRVRVGVPPDLELPARRGRVRPYRTVRGNLSLRLTGPG
ncbi:glycosyltransferase [Auraticoccus sp. F435]|uniref:Glycosyltransferase n=1 Tax=Auraticoccus cholistanensis TaxID=2656650 RepID=A0A6A9UYZ8_9ACTN|nr:glycosyltransferase [Auraticoccus cholistanensis]